MESVVSINNISKKYGKSLVLDNVSFDIPKGIEIHASTQCCIDTVEKLKFYESLGVSLSSGEYCGRVP